MLNQMYEDVPSSIMLDKTILIQLVNENLFKWFFFLLSCYKIKICQKDTVENHLKIQVLLKSKN